MRNTPTTPTDAPRRTRPAKGIDVPATVWLPPTDTVPDTAPTQPAVLPAWALQRVVTEYAAPDHSVVAVDTRRFFTGAWILAYQTLPAHHDPHAKARPRPRQGRVGLAILEIETPPRRWSDIAYPGDGILLVSHFLRPALRAAACHLKPGATLAIALPAPGPGPGAGRTSAVLKLAAEAGFSYQQQIAVVTGDLDGERIIARPTDAQARAVNTARRRHIPALVPTHLDLVILTLDKDLARA